MGVLQVNVCKAKLTASLLRPDPVSVSRDDVAKFFDILDSVLAKCHISDVQYCKNWFLKHCATSDERTIALLNYLLSLSHSFSLNLNDDRRGLHILYLLHDILHHVKFHDTHPDIFSKFPIHIITDITTNVALCHVNSETDLTKLGQLLTLWKSKKYLPDDQISRLSEILLAAQRGELKATQSNTQDDPSDTKSSSSSTKTLPLPSSHGDIADGYYDLPAGNFLGLLRQSNGNSINAKHVKPQELSSRHSSIYHLTHKLDEFLQSIDRVFSTTGAHPDEIIQDIDVLGRVSWRNTITGSIREADADSYYGWSREFCQIQRQKRPKVLHRSDDRASLSENE